MAQGPSGHSDGPNYDPEGPNDGPNDGPFDDPNDAVSPSDSLVSALQFAVHHTRTLQSQGLLALDSSTGLLTVAVPLDR